MFNLIESDYKGMFTQKVVSQYARLFEDKDLFIMLLLQR